jgi:hypothetical protein
MVASCDPLKSPQWISRFASSWLVSYFFGPIVKQLLNIEKIISLKIDLSKKIKIVGEFGCTLDIT